MVYIIGIVLKWYIIWMSNVGKGSFFTYCCLRIGLVLTSLSLICKILCGCFKLIQFLHFCKSGMVFLSIDRVFNWLNRIKI